MEKLQLVPVIHLVDGNALIENKITGEKLFTDPVDLAVELDELNFDELLLVDDIGEKDGQFSAFDLLYEMEGLTQFEIIAKGGLRSFEEISKAFEAGASRVQITSLSLSDPEKVIQLIDAYGSNSFIIGMDLQNDALVYENKQEKSDKAIEQIIDMFSALGVDRYSLNMIDDLGRNTQPSPVFLDRVVSAYPRINLFAGEGLDTTSRFDEFELSGIKGMFLGDAFYTNEDLFKGLQKYLIE
jgi:phosphoribosylformimino-5-aminoimidazole carboxamide ribonucleotide (ProFAR) isomerase